VLYSSQIEKGVRSPGRARLLETHGKWQAGREAQAREEKKLTIISSHPFNRAARGQAVLSSMFECRAKERKGRDTKLHKSHVVTQPVTISSTPFYGLHYLLRLKSTVGHKNLQTNVLEGKGAKDTRPTVPISSNLSCTPPYTSVKGISCAT
jgi:hypothetical protein